MERRLLQMKYRIHLSRLSLDIRDEKVCVQYTRTTAYCTIYAFSAMTLTKCALKSKENLMLDFVKMS